jgi:hypothetical protein
MNTRLLFLMLGLVYGFSNPASAQTKQSPPRKQNAQANAHIQVVFVLDATGSMSGLIHTAKEKIWSIANSLTQCRQRPIIEIGLVCYRDRGDEFVTKKIQLRRELDLVYDQLMDVVADGGGDDPESVNAALYEAVTRMNWSQQNSTYKAIFLVGDCPPHMDYNEVQYPRICALAKQKDICINTILMGQNPSTENVWRNIARNTNGGFLQVGMDANNLEVVTPYDEEIAAISEQLDELRYAYGNKTEQLIYETKKNAGRKIAAAASPASKAQRAEFNVSETGKAVYSGEKELLSDVASHKIKACEIPASELPTEFRKYRGAQLDKAIQQNIARKDSLNQKLTKLSANRHAFLQDALKSKSAEKVKMSFNNQVYEEIKKQAARKKIDLQHSAKF